MLLFLPILLMGHLTMASAQVPAFDIAPTCRAAETAADACKQDERRAHDNLESTWTHYTVVQRKRFTSLARLGAPPSYVDLLTCLEMAKAVDKLPDAHLDEQLDDVADGQNISDFLLHSIAYCPKTDLQGRLVDSSRKGFAQAVGVSVHSFVRMARLAEPLMPDGGCLLTVSYYGAEKVVDHYNVMGPVKAALEATVRYLAAELGSKGIRINALSPGPLKTRAASGIDHFDELIDRARERAPEHRLVTIEDVGAVAAGLVSDGARGVTGNIEFVDAGYHVMA